MRRYTSAQAQGRGGLGEQDLWLLQSYQSDRPVPQEYRMNQDKEFFLQYLFLITVPSSLLQLLWISKEFKLRLGGQSFSHCASTYPFSHTLFCSPCLHSLLLIFLVPQTHHVPSLVLCFPCAPLSLSIALLHSVLYPENSYLPSKPIQIFCLWKVFPSSSCS